MKKIRQRILFFMAAVFAAVIVFVSIGCKPVVPDPNPNNFRPIVFVHGMAGSADQFELQAMRFASNGYPASYISGFEYDTTMTSFEAWFYVENLNKHINAVLEETGFEQVDLLGHSMGTMVSQDYLSFDAYAAKVAHYVNIDGQVKDSLPGGVPTLALWAEFSVVGGGGTREIVGARNVLLPGTTHVQAASCTESFVEMFKFFNDDKEPATAAIEPSTEKNIVLGGKLSYFLTNNTPNDFTLEIYEVNKDTGFRINNTPNYTKKIDNVEGTFEMTDAKPGKSYEFYISRETYRQHLYYEPFVRSDRMIRLKTIPEDSIVDLMIARSDKTTSLAVIRNMEIRGSNTPSDDYDSLTINGTELATEEILPAASTGTIGFFVMDYNKDGASDLSQNIEIFSNIPFINAVDFYMPAADPPNGTIAIKIKERGTGGLKRVVNIPNWDSTQCIATVQFNNL
jgi:hypothetical protein